uniref:Ig-like domain-containing protein n=1 Tax=Hucho hucho TaxID=62062 RepID=A0A4W5PCQ0_9TELE
VLTIFGTSCFFPEGGNVTIDCHITSENINYMIWYKLTTGMVLQYITKSSKCQSDAYVSVQPGDSGTLNWTIHTETCVGEHSVYWFRHGPGESRPGIINTHGDRSDQCEKSPETGSPTQSCVYNLPKRNLSLSDAGTYYCAVASCGKILFGNWTKLDIQVDVTSIMYCYGSTSLTQNQDSNVVNYAAVSFTTKKSSFTRSGTREEPHRIKRKPYLYTLENTLKAL